MLLDVGRTIVAEMGANVWQEVRFVTEAMLEVVKRKMNTMEDLGFNAPEMVNIAGFHSSYYGMIFRSVMQKWICAFRILPLISKILLGRLNLK